MTDEQTPNQNDDRQEPLEHFDDTTFPRQAAGVLVSPSAFFAKLRRRPLKTSDWLAPMATLFLVFTLVMIGVSNSPEIRERMEKQQNAEIERQYKEAVESGEMTEEEATQRKLETKRTLKQFQGETVGYALQGVVVAVGGFLVFFVVSAFYFLVARYALRGEGGYPEALVANAQTAYILMIQAVVAGLLSVALGRNLDGVSVAALLDVENAGATRWFLSLLDPFSIWAYAVLGVGLAKMFKSEETGKYIVAVFILWVGYSLAVFLLTGANTELAGV
ncbi:MAG: hypothetical protein GF419_10325 [Ignavibacteriales bacterium]|nr:hypothetical protein [Ignavibacteriales bacterium]